MRSLQIGIGSGGVTVASGSSAETAFLANFDAADEATTYTAETGESGTFAGFGKIDSASTYLGTNCYYSASSTSAVSFTASSIDGAASGMVIEYARQRQNALTSNGNAVHVDLPSTVQIREVYVSTTPYVRVIVTGNTLLDFEMLSGSHSETGVQRHFYITISRDTDEVQVWQEGTSLGTQTLDGTGLTASPSTALRIGSDTSSNYVRGWFGFVRIQNGDAGLGGTVPTATPTEELDEARS